MSKPLVIGTGVVVVGVFALGGFFLWQQAGLNQLSPKSPAEQTPPPAPSPQPQTSDAEDFTLSEVEGWQTYRSEEFGFEVKYPKEGTISGSSSIRFDMGSIIFSPDGLIERGYENPDIVFETEDIIFAGMSATKTYTRGDDTVLEVLIRFDQKPNSSWAKDGEIQISINHGEESISNQQKVEKLEQILSTFRFIDEIPMPSTQWNWEILGCGSNAPCYYKVCSKSDLTDCYSCRGKRDPVHRGEKTPTATTDPQITTDFVCEGILTVTTDKSTYLAGEEVQITVTNGGSKEKQIWPLFSVERFEGRQIGELLTTELVSVPMVNCPCDALCSALPPYTIEPDGTLELQWNSKEESCKDFVLESNNASPGTYRVAISVIDELGELDEKIYSAQFQIQ